MNGYNKYHYVKLILEKHTPCQVLRICSDMLKTGRDKELIKELIASI